MSFVPVQNKDVQYRYLHVQVHNCKFKCWFDFPSFSKNCLRQRMEKPKEVI